MTTFTRRAACGMMATGAVGAVLATKRANAAKVTTSVGVSFIYGDDYVPLNTYFVMVKTGANYKSLFFDTSTGYYYTGTDSVTDFLEIPGTAGLDADFATGCVAGGLGDIDLVNAAGNIVPALGTLPCIAPSVVTSLVLTAVDTPVVNGGDNLQPVALAPVQPPPQPQNPRYGWLQILPPKTQPGPKPYFGPVKPGEPVPPGRQRFFFGPTLELPNNPFGPRAYKYIKPGFIFGFRF